MKENSHHGKLYNYSDIAIIIPTKDRPEKIKCLLQSLTEQTVKCGRIIIVASGIDLTSTIAEFAQYLPIEYHHSSIPGQIRQRNIGISLLDKKSPLVCFLDDCNTLHPSSFEKMIHFWNTSQIEPGGVAFNIISSKIRPHRFIYNFFFIGSKTPGRILSSGMNTGVTNVTEDIKTEWLPGGITVWRQDILKQFPHKEIYAKRAACEDVIFSYPIGKIYPLYVCADSKVYYQPVKDHVLTNKYEYYYYVESLWRYYFVTIHPELSIPHLLWMEFGRISYFILKGLFCWEKQYVETVKGILKALIIGSKYVLRGKNLEEILHEPIDYK